jgi:hypothetical protein
MGLNQGPVLRAGSNIQVLGGPLAFPSGPLSSAVKIFHNGNPPIPVRECAKRPPGVPTR